MERLPPPVADRATAIQVAVVGAGPAGLTAALALARAGVATALIGPRRSDPRTSALMVSSVTALDALGVWPRCAEAAAPLKGLRIVDDTDRLLRAPETLFAADEAGLDAFAWNIRNDDLAAAMWDCALEAPALTHVDATAQSIAFSDDDVTLTLSDGRTLSTRLVVAADGRGSRCRDAAGLTMRTRDYGQTALALNLATTRPHDNISTEFHTAGGPFTLVPLPGRHASLVWVMRSHDAESFVDAKDERLAADIEARSHAILGGIRVAGVRGVFPLVHESASRLAAHRLILVGEAGHVLPPIGAQGLNLGLRDAATAAEIAADAVSEGRDPGDADVTAAYERARRLDVASRSVAVDWLNRSLLTDFLPVQAARGLALEVIGRLSPLRRAVMREGVRPLLATPRLMQG